MKIVTLGSGSNGNCYLLELNNKTIILDCGLKFEDITKSPHFPKFRNISFVFVSHIHGDHNKSIQNFKMSGCEMLTYEMLEPKVQRWNIDDFDITTFPVAHNVSNWGIIIKCKEENVNFCYCTDFNQIPKITGITHWLFEVNYIENFIDEMIEENKDLKNLGFNNHNSLENTLDYFTKQITQKPKLIMCCHLSNSNAIARRIQLAVEPLADNVLIAKKGEIYEN